MNYRWAVLAYGLAIFAFGLYMEGRSRRRGRGPAKPHPPPDQHGPQMTPHDKKSKAQSAAAASLR